MNKTNVLAVTNIALFLALSLQVFTGLILLLKGIETAGYVHLYNSAVLAALIIAHLVLNWGWVRSVFSVKREA